MSKNKDNVDLQVALQNAKNELLELDNRITSQKSENLVNEKALEKEKADAIQATIDADKKRLEESEKNANKTVDTAKKTGKAEVKIAELTAETKSQIVATALGQVASLVGEESKAGKALAVGQALINTYQGATKALAQGGIFGAIGAAGVVAAGMSSVKKIVSTKLPGVTDSPPPTPEPDIPTTSIGGIGGLVPNVEAISPPDISQQPVQAFVVENDISNSQALQEELEIQATL